MALDGSITDVEVLWKAFGDYVCKPYANNPERLGQLKVWFDELYSRRDDEGMELSYREVTGDEKTFHAFCLNDQMYFSHDSAVMSLPWAVGDMPGRPPSPEKNVGIWLYDFGVPDAATKAICQPGTSTDVEADFTPYTATIARTILNQLNNDVPVNQGGGSFEFIKIHDSRWPHFARPFSTLLPFVRVQSMSEQEYDADKPWHIDNKVPACHFSRVVLHSLWNTGTIYAIGRREDILVVCPPGASSSHLIYANYADKGMGVFHRSGWHPEGRAVVDLTMHPQRGHEDEFWKIRPATPSPSL